MSNIGGSLRDLIIGDNPSPALLAAWKRLEAAEVELVAACRELIRMTGDPPRRRLPDIIGGGGPSGGLLPPAWRPDA
jgi:hypothetical protein